MNEKVLLSLFTDAEPTAALGVLEHGVREYLAIELPYRIGDQGQLIPRTAPRGDDARSPLLTDGVHSAPTIVGVDSVGVELSIYAGPTHATPLRRLLAHLADALDSWQGRVVGLKMGNRLTRLAFSPLLRSPFPHQPEQGLPALCKADRDTPTRLGWITAWSAPLAARAGFTTDLLDSDFFHAAQVTPKGTWVFQLTDDPIDLDRSEHVAALRRLLAAFPGIGARDRPLPPPRNLDAPDDDRLRPGMRRRFARLREAYEARLAAGDVPPWPPGT